ncbi:MAG: methyltransferase domain-containing protein [Elusimicrobia bacterium]|nr:methyltransferase domain-containing protein [Elusimicrobiota bacterium]
MKLTLLPLLACPGCAAALEFAALREHPREDVDLDSGSLRCVGCGKSFPIVDGIPRLRPGDALADGRVARTAESFGFEWHRYPGSRPVDEAIFLEEVQLPPEALKGKLTLDAGCGMGRFTTAARGLGAEVVAMDLSEALTRLIGAMKADPRLHVVQGDLLHPPFKPGVFDLVFSHGVIHHTADTKGAFDAVAKLVKRGGLLSVWVYGTPGPWSSFKTNPLRSTRAWLKDVLWLVWLVVWARQIVSDSLRVVTTRLPVWLLYALCWPLTVLGALPLVKFLTYSVDPQFKVRLIENFDWLAPPFQTKHTKEEVRPWFTAAGYEPLSQLPHGVVPKIGFLGRRR